MTSFIDGPPSMENGIIKAPRNERWLIVVSGNRAAGEAGPRRAAGEAAATRRTTKARRLGKSPPPLRMSHVAGMCTTTDVVRRGWPCSTFVER